MYHNFYNDLCELLFSMGKRIGVQALIASVTQTLEIQAEYKKFWDSCKEQTVGQATNSFWTSRFIFIS